MDRQGFVYIMTNQRNGTLYIGVTNDLGRRVAQHRAGNVEGFTRQYGLCRLVYWEHYPDVPAAIAREKQLKNWRRAWKIDLIQSTNLEWRDLYVDLFPGERAM